MAIVAMTGCTSAEGVRAPNYDFTRVSKVAIVDVKSGDLNVARENQISDWFAMELMKHGYGIVEREQVQTILKEQEFQASDLTSPSQAARAGQILNVPAVVTLSVPEYGNKISMTAKMIDVETAEIIWIGEGSARTGRTIATIGGALVGAGAGYAAGGDSTGKAVGAAVGGAAGGAAGYLFSPSEEKQARKALNKMSESLPNRLSNSP
jgi:hypothetical protein